MTSAPGKESCFCFVCRWSLFFWLWIHSIRIAIKSIAIPLKALTNHILINITRTLFLLPQESQDTFCSSEKSEYTSQFFICILVLVSFVVKNQGKTITDQDDVFSTRVSSCDIIPFMGWRRHKLGICGEVCASSSLKEASVDHKPPELACQC